MEGSVREVGAGRVREKGQRWKGGTVGEGKGVGSGREGR